MQSPQQERQSQGINRTICIGLGGTGRDVLMRIRRLIVDRYGNLNNLPIVSFVHIDTDKAGSQVSGLRTGSTYHGVDLSFREAEKVSATMTTTEITNFVQGLERRSNYDRQSPYDHIGIWFPPQLLRNIKAIEEGAKGIRPVGRLAFFHNYSKIKTAIDTAEKRTRGHEANLLKSGLRVEPGLNIFVVGSLCGGTGSGMFLDVAYSLRRAYGDQGAQIVGYLVISPELYGNTPNMIANSYAALKELNHYTTPGTQFDACYDMQDLVIVQEQRPPFDYTYLVSNQTPGEYAILEQSKLCNVIAHKIALDFSGELAPVVKGMRDNFLQHMIQWDSHPRPNIQRFLTFGFAAIYFPRDIIVQTALKRISWKLVNFWVNGEGQSPDPQRLLEQFYLQYRWHSDLAQKDGLSIRLSEGVQEANKTFINTINTWSNKLDKSITNCQNKDDRTGIRQQLPREFREQFRKIQPGETENSRGIWLTRLQQIRPRITESLQENIDEFLLALLTPSNANFSVKSTREWLEALKTDLNSYQRKLEEQIINFSGARTLEDIEKKWRDTEQIIEDIEQKFVLMGKNAQVQTEAKRVVREVCQIIKHNFDLEVTQESLKIVNDLQKHLQNRINQVAGFSNLLGNLKTNYEKEEYELKQLHFDEMSGEAIFATEDLEGCYSILLPEKDFRSQVVLVSLEITEPAGRGESLGCFIERDRLSENQLQSEINLTVDRLFGARSTTIVESVIKRFMQYYSSSERPVRLGQIMQEAEPLLRLNLTDAYFRNTSSKSSKLIGFKNSDESEVVQFKTLLLRDLGISDSVLKPTQAKNEIIIVNEYAGFPLRLIHGLEQMRKPYLREKELNGAFLHNDKQDNFLDIIPPDARTIEELEDIFYPCLAFNLVQQNPETYQLEFGYYDALRDSNFTASLSPVWNQALEELANRADMTKALQQLLDSAIANIEQNRDLWQSFYLPKLREFVNKVDQLPENDPNYPYKIRVVGTRGTIENLAQEGIITRFLRKMEARVKLLPPVNNPAPVITDNQHIITGEILVDSTADAEDNRTQRRIELQQLKQDLEEGYITVEEFESLRLQVFKKYPI